MYLTNFGKKHVCIYSTGDAAHDIIDIRRLGTEDRESQKGTVTLVDGDEL